MWDKSSKAIRGGTRGGKDQFKWDEVRRMSYRDRECYLGYTTKLGFLDKGGKWRKKNWWINDKGKAGGADDLAKEIMR
jgi:hypothetical protein